MPDLEQGNNLLRRRNGSVEEEPTHPANIDGGLLVKKL